MAALIRVLVYATLFVAAVLILLPGVGRPSSVGIVQIAGGVITFAGLMLAVWCVLTFAVVGRGTPLPFDPPRRLVLIGPYQFVRNPMAIGVGLALVGVALFYGSVAFLASVALFMLAIHAMVTLYEEPTLRRTFGVDYATYCEKVNRWLPRRPDPNVTSEAR
jgi:protein-S-isoprenylcysteine O-methyltransferase Ste14